MPGGDPQSAASPPILTAITGSGGRSWRIAVAPADIDHMGHVNNSIYLRWVELAVHAHWTSLATSTEFAAFLWIAVRHEIDYRLPAFAGEAIAIDVRITEVRRARAWYRTIISRDGATLAEITSCWCCVAADTRQLTVIPREVGERFLARSV